MANIVKVKRSNVAGKVPTTTEITGGELGVNMADKKIFINNGANIEQVGSGTLAGLSDSAITNPLNNDYLIYNGTKWVNTDRVNAKTIFEIVKNVSGATLAKGTPVYQVGISGNAITVGYARADDPNKIAIGVMDETTADQAEGRMTILGEIKGVNTNGFATGDKVYLGATGGYTNIAPTDSNVFQQFLGVVFRIDGNNGSGYITGTLTEDAVRWTGTALQYWNGTSWESIPNSSSAVTVYGYDNRGSLRTLAGTTGKQAIVQGLGLFVYEENSDEPDDDETCFANGTGRWLIETASFDLVDLWIQAENEATEDYIDSRFADLTTGINGLFIQTTITCTITAVNSTSLASFSTTIVGANVGDSVVVNPPSSSLELAGSPDGLTYFATITAQDTLTVTLVNATASQLGVNTTTQTTPWTVTVIRNL